MTSYGINRDNINFISCSYLYLQYIIPFLIIKAIFALKTPAEETYTFSFQAHVGYDGFTMGISHGRGNVAQCSQRRRIFLLRFLKDSLSSGQATSVHLQYATL